MNRQDEVHLGKNVQLIHPVHPNIWSSEPYLITIGDNTTISFDTVFITHCGETRVFRNLANNDKEKQTVIYKPIKVGNNCFIGCRSTILPGVTIGNNVIIGANSLVTTDVPDNVVCAGIPSKVICTLDEYKAKHKDEFMFCVQLPYNEKKNYLTNKYGLK